MFARFTAGECPAQARDRLQALCEALRRGAKAEAVSIHESLSREPWREYGAPWMSTAVSGLHLLIKLWSSCNKPPDTVFCVQFAVFWPSKPVRVQSLDCSWTDVFEQSSTCLILTGFRVSTRIYLSPNEIPCQTFTRSMLGLVETLAAKKTARTCRLRWMWVVSARNDQTGVLWPAYLGLSPVWLSRSAARFDNSMQRCGCQLGPACMSTTPHSAWGSLSRSTLGAGSDIPQAVFGRTLVCS